MRLGEGVQQQLEEASAGGKGVVFATAHLGPIDRMAALVAASGFRVATLARESYDPRLTALYDRVRGGRGIESIYRGRPGAELAVVRALRRGNLVGFPMDLPGRGMAHIEVPFLGGTQRMAAGRASIALRTGANLVVGTPSRGEGDGLVVTVERVNIEAGDGVEQLTRRVAERLDRRIRGLPERWPWMEGSQADCPE